MKSFATKALAGFLLLTFTGGGFVWGFFAHKSRIFPFHLLRSAAQKTNHIAHDPVEVGAAGIDLSALRSLPYTGGTFDPDGHLRDVLVHDPSKVYPGLNLYAAREQGAAYLIDMDGKVAHRWELPGTGFHHVDVFPNGDLLAVQLSKQIIRIDKDSQPLWSTEEEFHHDVWIEEDGHIRALVHRPRLISALHPRIPVRDERLLTLTAEGDIVDDFSILESLMASPFAFLVPSVAHLTFAETQDAGTSALDLLHSNHVQVFDGSLAERSPLFAAGNLMISLRNINTIGILNGESHELLWAWGASNLYRQHQPMLLDNGNILIFNNGTESSQILELDPLTNLIVWQYEDPGEFFTRTRGSLQRLDNGNTLITESDPGYVFEVTASGEVVWKFANPHVDDQGIRGTIWRMVRLDPEAVPFLRRRS